MAHPVPMLFHSALSAVGTGNNLLVTAVVKMFSLPPPHTSPHILSCLDGEVKEQSENLSELHEEMDISQVTYINPRNFWGFCRGSQGDVVYLG